MTQKILPSFNRLNRLNKIPSFNQFISENLYDNYSQTNRNLNMSSECQYSQPEQNTNKQQDSTQINQQSYKFNLNNNHFKPIKPIIYHEGDSFSPDPNQNKSSGYYEQQSQTKTDYLIESNEKKYYTDRFTQQNLLKQQINQQAININDTFLDLVQEHLNKIKKGKQQLIQLQTNQQLNNKTVFEQNQIISISKHQLKHFLLQNQIINDSLHMTNLLNAQINVKLMNIPFEFKLIMLSKQYKNKLNSVNSQLQINLMPFQSVQILFQIKKTDQQLGNIYETLIIQVMIANQIQQHKIKDNFITMNPLNNLIQKRDNRIKKFIRFQINFIKPKLQISFLGKINVIRVQQHKIAMIDLFPTSSNQYFINLLLSNDQFQPNNLININNNLSKPSSKLQSIGFSQTNSQKLHKIQCKIQIKGDNYWIQPNSTVLYLNQPTKLIIREKKKFNHSEFNKNQRKSVIIIKPLNSSLSYVIGVRVIRKEEIKDRISKYEGFDRIESFKF